MIRQCVTLIWFNRLDKPLLHLLMYFLEAAIPLKKILKRSNVLVNLLSNYT